jgi:hypothetical protein
VRTHGITLQLPLLSRKQASLPYQSTSKNGKIRLQDTWPPGLSYSSAANKQTTVNPECIDGGPNPYGSRHHPIQMTLMIGLALSRGGVLDPALWALTRRLPPSDQLTLRWPSNGHTHNLSTPHQSLWHPLLTPPRIVSPQHGSSQRQWNTCISPPTHKMHRT